MSSNKRRETPRVSLFDILSGRQAPGGVAGPITSLFENAKQLEELENAKQLEELKNAKRELKQAAENQGKEISVNPGEEKQEQELENGPLLDQYSKGKITAGLEDIKQDKGSNNSGGQAPVRVEGRSAYLKQDKNQEGQEHLELNDQQPEKKGSNDSDLKNSGGQAPVGFEGSSAYLKQDNKQSFKQQFMSIKGNVLAGVNELTPQVKGHKLLTLPFVLAASLVAMYYNKLTTKKGNDISGKPGEAKLEQAAENQGNDIFSVKPGEAKLEQASEKNQEFDDAYNVFAGKYKLNEEQAEQLKLCIINKHSKQPLTTKNLVPCFQGMGYNEATAIAAANKVGGEVQELCKHIE